MTEFTPEQIAKWDEERAVILALAKKARWSHWRDRPYCEPGQPAYVLIRRDYWFSMWIEDGSLCVSQHGSAFNWKVFGRLPLHDPKSLTRKALCEFADSCVTIMDALETERIRKRSEEGRLFLESQNGR